MSSLSAGLHSSTKKRLKEGGKLVLLGGAATALAEPLKACARVELWRGFSKDSFAELPDSIALVVFLDSSSEEDRARVADLCRRVEVQCIKLPQSQGVITDLVRGLPPVVPGTLEESTEQRRAADMSLLIPRAKVRRDNDPSDATAASGDPDGGPSVGKTTDAGGASADLGQAVTPLVVRLEQQLDSLAGVYSDLTDTLREAKGVLEGGGAIKQQNAELKAEVKRLQEENERLEGENAQLREKYEVIAGGVQYLAKAVAEGKVR